WIIVPSAGAGRLAIQSDTSVLAEPKGVEIVIEPIRPELCSYPLGSSIERVHQDLTDGYGAVALPIPIVDWDAVDDRGTAIEIAAVSTDYALFDSGRYRHQFHHRAGLVGVGNRDWLIKRLASCIDLEIGCERI